MVSPPGACCLRGHTSGAIQYGVPTACSSSSEHVSGVADDSLCATPKSANFTIPCRRKKRTGKNEMVAASRLVLLPQYCLYADCTNCRSNSGTRMMAILTKSHRQSAAGNPRGVRRGARGAHVFCRQDVSALYVAVDYVFVVKVHQAFQYLQDGGQTKT